MTGKKGKIRKLEQNGESQRWNIKGEGRGRHKPTDGGKLFRLFKLQLTRALRSSPVIGVVQNSFRLQFHPNFVDGRSAAEKRNFRFW